MAGGRVPPAQDTRPGWALCWHRDFGVPCLARAQGLSIAHLPIPARGQGATAARHGHDRCLVLSLLAHGSGTDGDPTPSAAAATSAHAQHLESVSKPVIKLLRGRRGSSAVGKGLLCPCELRCLLCGMCPPRLGSWVPTLWCHRGHSQSGAGTTRLTPCSPSTTPACATGALGRVPSPQ